MVEEGNCAEHRKSAVNCPHRVKMAEPTNSLDTDTRSTASTWNRIQREGEWNEWDERETG
jgi:hypothetical protein